MSQKQENTNSRVLKDRKNEIDFHRFMEKLVTNQSKSTINHKFTEEFFDKLSHKTFEILSNLPTGGHGNIYFIPNNEE